MMTSNGISRADEPASLPVSRQPNPRQQILVVEDDADIRRLNTEVLIYSGYQVDVAEDGAVAWEAIQVKQYDLVVTDNEMPKLTGVELLQKLQTARMALPVIMATGAMPEEALARHGLADPAMILLKPYTCTELLDAVKAVLSANNGGRQEETPPLNWQGQPLGDGFQL